MKLEVSETKKVVTLYYSPSLLYLSSLSNIDVVGESQSSFHAKNTKFISPNLGLHSNLNQFLNYLISLPKMYNFQK